MKIISHFKKLKAGSKFTLKFRAYEIEVFCGFGLFEYGLEITLPKGRPINKEYDKFSIITRKRDKNQIVVISSKVGNEEELEVFAYLLEYVIFELSKNIEALPSDNKKYRDYPNGFS